MSNCTYVLYRFTPEAFQSDNPLAHREVIECLKPATKIYRHTHPRLIETYGEAKPVCDDHYETCEMESALHHAMDRGEL